VGLVGSVDALGEVGEVLAEVAGLAGGEEGDFAGWNAEDDAGAARSYPGVELTFAAEAVRAVGCCSRVVRVLRAVTHVLSHLDAERFESAPGHTRRLPMRAVISVVDRAVGDVRVVR
jgi:hypothetical protein